METFKLESKRDFSGDPVAKTLCTRDLGSIPGQGTRSHRLQLRVCMLQLKITHAATKTWHSQINKQVLFQERLQFLKGKMDICLTL